MEPIAIIGIGCRFPGGANTPQDFWQLISTGTDAITTIPQDRFDVDALYDPTLATPGKIITRQGGFLTGIDRFDPYFFGIAPRETVSIDPQQRLLLEVAWEALEDAGTVVDKLAGSPTGVFVGIWTNDYADYMYDVISDIDLYMTTGGGRYSTSGRLSYTFDLRGPSLTVDTACSSSLVAVHLACQSLWNKECTLALAGGANIILSPHISIGYSRSKMLSADGRCKFGDARADGYVRSEGVGIVVLKPLAQALTDRDSIYAVIRGSAVGNDGRSSSSLVAPGTQGQIQTLQEAYRCANVLPGQVQYIEAHGTGTSVGDRVEIEALSSVLAVGRSQEQPCLIGSVKTNIGHTEAASGVAGLIKAALCLKHRAIPPSLHLQQPNPSIHWDDIPLVIQQELRPWPADNRPALAGVNSFGVTGTNAHVVLEEAPQRPMCEALVHAGEHSLLLPISARHPQALQDLASAYQHLLRTSVAQGSLFVEDLCYTASVRRSHHIHRLAVVGDSWQELAERLQGLIENAGQGEQVSPGSLPQLVFVFPGQGSQWVGMGRQLLTQEAVFRQHVELCAQAFAPYVDWSLLDVLTQDSAAERLQEIAVIQPVLFAFQVSLAALWRSWGIEPDAVVGHSMGEIAAAQVAGILSLQEAACIICRRSQLLRSIRGQGAMALVELSLEQAQAALGAQADQVAVAVSNSSRSTVLSGVPAALETVCQRLEQQGVFWRKVNVDVASHSPQVDPLLTDLLDAIVGIDPTMGDVPFYSTVLARQCEGHELDAVYWVRNLRDPVHFATVVQQLLSTGPVTFLEISAHPILLPAIEQEIHESKHEGLVLASLRREEDESALLLETLGKLYCQGRNPIWEVVAPQVNLISLPAYPWQRERFWLNAEGKVPQWRRPLQLHRHKMRSVHPLLATSIYTPAQGGMRVWEIELGPQRLAYLADHCVAGVAILPAAVSVELALAAALQVSEAGMPVLETVNFQKALVFNDGVDRALQFVLTTTGLETANWQLFSRPAGEDEQQTWELHVTGSLSRDHAAETIVPSLPLRDIRARQHKHISQAEFYQILTTMQLQYGQSFQAIEQAWYREGEALGELKLPGYVAMDADAYHVHPVLLDACLQLLLVALCGSAADVPSVPIRLERVRFYGHNAVPFWGYARATDPHVAKLEPSRGEVTLLDEQGRPLLVVEGVRIQRLEKQPASVQSIDELFYELCWRSTEPVSVREQAQKVLAQASYLVFADTRGVAANVQQRFQAQGQRCVLVFAGDVYKQLAPDRWQINPRCPDDVQQLLRDALPAHQPPCRSIVHMWCIDDAQVDLSVAGRLLAAQELSCRSLLNLVQAVAQLGWREAPRLWLISAGTQSIDPNPQRSASPGQSLLRGLGRTLALEHPEWNCSCIDLSTLPNTEEIAGLYQELLAQSPEEQVALRDQQRYVARLVHSSAITNTAALSSGSTKQLVRAEVQPYTLEMSTPGDLDTLHLQATQHRVPGPGEVEIAVHAAGLNFLDVLAAMGIRPDQPGVANWFGLECSGSVVAVGGDSTAFAVGDEVVAIAPGAFGAFVTTRIELVAHKPTRLSFAEAATLPVTFMTALYALEQLGHVRAGERVLIHSAAGGVGLAAIQIAQQAGAQIFATAGSQQKRDYLHALGIEHVFDSRNVAFAEQILQATSGQGVDIVLNSLTGDAIAVSLSVLAPYGRFLEIGKKDIYQNMQIGLLPFQKNLSYMAIDLAKMFVERAQECAVLLQTVLERIEQGSLSPLPYQTFPLSQAIDAFRAMAQARHRGKIVLEVDVEPVEVVTSDQQPAICAHGTYLLTGGYGGLGLQVANWLVQQGARHLILLGRLQPGEQQQQNITELEQAGAQIIVRQADVAQAGALAAILQDLPSTLPPVRGIFHAAGILDDGLFLRQEWSRLVNVLAPKVMGAWHLHQLSLAMPLDYFVLFSSVTAWLGSPGQAGYTAANAFLDELARYRRGLNLPAVSIAWGPWAEVGLAAAQTNRGERLASRGIASLQPQQGILALEEILRRNWSQIAVMGFNPRQWKQFYPKATHSQFLSELLDETEHDETSVRSVLSEKLRACEPGQRSHLLEDALRAQVAQVLGLDPTRIGRQIPFGSLGIDSLTALELRNRLEVASGLTLSTTVLWAYPTLAQLATYIATKIGLPLEQDKSEQAQERDQAAQDTLQLQAELEQFTEAELLLLLNDKLASMDIQS